MPEISTATWPSVAKIGEEVTLTCTFKALKNPYTISFEIVEYSANKGNRSIQTFTRQLAKGDKNASVKWKVKHVEEETRSAGFPEYKFIAKIGSASHTSNQLDIGSIDKPRWENPGTIGTAPQGESSFLFSLNDTLTMTVTGSGLDNYVWDFTVFLRERNSNNKLVHTVIGTANGIRAGTNKVQAPFSFASLDPAKYLGKKFDFTYNYRLSTAGVKSFSEPGEIISDVAEAIGVKITLENEKELFPVTSGEELVYKFRVVGLPSNIQAQLEAGIDPNLIDGAPLLDPPLITGSDTMALMSLKIAKDVMDRAKITFPVYLKSAADGRVLDFVKVPIELLEFKLVIYCNAIDPFTVVNELDSDKISVLTVYVATLPGLEATVTINGAGGLSALGINAPVTELKKNIISDSAVPFVFNLTRSGGLKAGIADLLFTASVPGHKEVTCSIQIEVIQVLTFDSNISSYNLKFGQEEIIDIEVERQYDDTIETIPVNVLLLDPAGNLLDTADYFKTFDFIFYSVTFKDTGFTDNQKVRLKITVKPKTAAQIKPFTGSILLTSSNESSPIYTVVDHSIDITITS